MDPTAILALFLGLALSVALLAVYVLVRSTSRAHDALAALISDHDARLVALERTRVALAPQRTPVIGPPDPPRLERVTIHPPPPEDPPVTPPTTSTRRRELDRSLAEPASGPPEEPGAISMMSNALNLVMGFAGRRTRGIRYQEQAARQREMLAAPADSRPTVVELTRTLHSAPLVPVPQREDGSPLSERTLYGPPADSAVARRWRCLVAEAQLAGRVARHCHKAPRCPGADGPCVCGCEGCERVTELWGRAQREVLGR